MRSVDRRTISGHKNETTAIETFETVLVKALAFSNGRNAKPGQFVLSLPAKTRESLAELTSEDTIMHRGFSCGYDASKRNK